ncbi:homeobox-leucine zipper protein HDG11 [Tanacetum coccineum]|uniref:Homeobox-leucine zipper protein HDG11 n=1 Tax=Tanacetum coccineum TaxID=301880 RepID=A0ABQ4WUP3_9ASTR
MNSPPNYKWEQLLDIDDSDLPLTPALRPCNTHVRETTTTTTTQNHAVDNLEEKPVRIIPGPAEYIRKVVDDVDEDEDFKGRHGLARLSLLMLMVGEGIVNGCLRDIENYLKNGRLEQVVAIIKSCTSNALSDLIVTLKDLSGINPGTIHHKVINEEGYGKDITVRSALILANVSIFSLTLSMHYLNITLRNMVKVFHKDTFLGNGSGVGGSEMLMEEEEIVKLMEEEEMAGLELHVCGNVTDQEDLYKFEEKALNLTLEEEARQAWAEHEYLHSANHIQTPPYVKLHSANAEGGGALGSLGALKPSTHPVISIFLYPLGADVETACALEVEAVGALDLMEALKVEVEAEGGDLDLVEALKVEVEAEGALDLVEVEAAGALDLMEGALDLVEVEASCLVGALDVVGLSLNILISASVSRYLTSLKQTTSSSPEKPSSLDT